MARRSPLFAALAAFAASVGLVAPGPAAARGSRFTVEPPEPEKLRVFQYAAMSGADCLAELWKRRVPFELAPPTKGVDTPLRFTGPLRGVRFRPHHQPVPDAENHVTIADCRLALALDDLAAMLASRGAVEVVYWSMYRKRGAGWIKPGKRHPGGRAIDLVAVRLEDGTEYGVHRDFHGRLGAITCGEKAKPPTKDTPGARFFRDMVCAMERTKSFNLLLTPNHDWAHRDHLHMEVRSGIKWYLIH